MQFIGLAEMYLERFEAAVAHARRGTAAARAGGQTQMVPVIAIPHGFAAAMLGRLDEARGVLDGAVEETRLVDSGFALAWVSMNAAFVAALAGDLAGPATVATEVLELLAGMDESVVVANAKTVLGQVELDEGRPGAAIETLHRRRRRSGPAADRRVLEGVPARVADRGTSLGGRPGGSHRLRGLAQPVRRPARPPAHAGHGEARARARRAQAR